jgi:hypothetical protein
MALMGVFLVFLFFVDKTDAFRHLLLTDRAKQMYLILLGVNIILSLTVPLWYLFKDVREHSRLLKEIDRENGN